MKVSRRNALMKLGLGTGSLLLFPRASRVLAKPQSHDLMSFAEQIRQKPRAQILQLAGEWIGKGVDYQTMLGAVFLAGIHDIEPWHVGGKLHAVIMVASIFDLTDTASPEEAWLATLWNLDDFKRSQADDLNRGDWVLPPRPTVSFSTEAKAREAFLAAMDAWDPKQADRALVGLMPFHTQDSLFEVIWPLAARCYVNIGHKIIYAAQIERTISRLGWRYAEPTLRSLILGLLFRAPGQTEAFERSRTLIHSFPKTWTNGRSNPNSSITLLKQIRLASPEQAQKLVIDALQDGLGLQTIWDGLRLFASELFQRHPKTKSMADRRVLLPVHPLTVTNAFGYASRKTQNESTQRLLLLQATAYLAQLRDSLIDMIKLPMASPGIDQLGNDFQGANTNLAQSYADYSATAAKVVLERDPSLAPAFRRQMRTALFHKGIEHHQHKYAAAVWEESLLVHPQWQSHILAPAVTYLNSNEADTEMSIRARAILRKATP